MRNKKKIKLKRKRVQKIKKGINVPFELHKRPLRSLENRYFYKANMHMCSGKKRSFENVRFRSSNMTKSKFNGASFKGVDFIFTNLKKSIFRNCFFKDVIFFGSNMKKCKFINSKFQNVYFINIDKSKFIGIDNNEVGTFFINNYPNIKINENLKIALDKITLNNRIFKYNVIHVSKNKPNYWIINMLLKDFSQVELAKGFDKLSTNLKNNNKMFFTYYSFKDFFSKYLKKEGIY